MPAKSKKQQKFMGMVHAAQKGDLKTPSPEVKKVAKSMKKKDTKDFASTKHKGLPNKVKKEVDETIQNVVFNEAMTRARFVNEVMYNSDLTWNMYDPENWTLQEGDKVILRSKSHFYKQQGKAKYGTIYKIDDTMSLPFRVKWEKEHNNGTSDTNSYRKTDLEKYKKASLKSWLKEVL